MIKRLLPHHLAVMFLLCGVVCTVPYSLHAEENKEIHDELRALRRGMVEAIDKADLDKMMPYMTPDVVITWQDGTVSRGHDGVRAYYNRMMTGPERVVQSFKTTVEVDDLTVLHNGDTGISFGKSVDEFKLTSGLEFKLTGRWSAALVKTADGWKIASCHMSTNLFDNPLLNAMKRMAYVVGGVTLVVGLIIGFVLGKKRKA
jgi:uncharacterized protein (TIGR02246 family)